MGPKWSVITDILVVSGYFAAITRLANRQEFFWFDFTFFWFLDHCDKITIIGPSIIFSDIIELNMKMIRKRGVLKTELIPAPN